MEKTQTLIPKRVGFVLLFLVVLRGVRFPPHKEGPGFESQPGILRGDSSLSNCSERKKKGEALQIIFQSQ